MLCTIWNEASLLFQIKHNPFWERFYKKVEEIGKLLKHRITSCSLLLLFMSFTHALFLLNTHSHAVTLSLLLQPFGFLTTHQEILKHLLPVPKDTLWFLTLHIPLCYGF